MSSKNFDAWDVWYACFRTFNDTKHDPVVKHSRKCLKALTKTTYKVIEAEEVSHDEDTI